MVKPRIVQVCVFDLHKFPMKTMDGVSVTTTTIWHNQFKGRKSPFCLSVVGTAGHDGWSCCSWACGGAQHQGESVVKNLMEGGREKVRERDQGLSVSFKAMPQ